jgi:hypothetical protein
MHVFKLGGGILKKTRYFHLIKVGTTNTTGQLSSASIRKMNFKWRSIMVLTLCIIPFTRGTTDIEVIKDFLSANNVQICLVLFCDQVFAVKLHRLMQKLSIWSAFQDTSQTIENPNKLFNSRTHQIGVIYDLRCPDTEQLFSISFREHIFNASYHWLMFHNDLEVAKSLLRPQYINWDAEISLTIKQENGTAYQIYDVYNPSFERGGQLNATFMGVWSTTNRNLTPFRVPNKNVHRRNLFGLQFMASTVVSYSKMPRDYLLSSVFFKLNNVPRNRSFIQYLEGEDNTHMDSLPRLNYHLMQIVMENCNFT